jgi:hypothetical protein
LTQNSGGVMPAACRSCDAVALLVVACTHRAERWWLHEVGPHHAPNALSWRNLILDLLLPCTGDISVGMGGCRQRRKLRRAATRKSPQWNAGLLCISTVGHHSTLGCNHTCCDSCTLLHRAPVARAAKRSRLPAASAATHENTKAKSESRN